MKRNNLIDYLIILLVSLAVSCFPFALFLKDFWLLFALIISQIALLVFKRIYIVKKTDLKFSFNKVNLKNTLLFIPVIIACFSNYLYLAFSTSETSFLFTYIDVLKIVEALFVAINEEILFRLLLIDNLEDKSPVFKVLVSSLIFAGCHLTGFISTFNPSALIQVVYTFPLGILLAIVFIETESLIPCIALHFLFNTFNNVVFECIKFGNVNNVLYIISNVIVAVIVAIYVGVILLIKFKKTQLKK